MNKSSGTWFKEWLTPNESHSHRINKVLIRTKTRFQNAVIADSASFGRCLILDGEMQSAELDEFIYHEALVHPALFSHSAPKTVLVLGGGEGATVREILKHKTVKKAVMVDIDGEVVDLCKKHMKEWHQGSFSDPRAELIIADAKKFIEETGRKFDVIFSDLPSPVEGGPAVQLYTVEFYRALVKKLSKNGIFALQAGSACLLQRDMHLKLYRTLKQVFPVVRSYSAHIPSFDVPWAFFVCARSEKTDPLKLSASAVERRIRARGVRPLSFYDGMTHEGLLRIPKNLRDALDQEKGMITMKHPIYFDR